MSFAQRPFDRFVRSLHRRFVLVRALERAGWGVLFGSVAAILLLPILVLRGESAWPIVTAALAVGALAGAIAGWTRRPCAFDAVLEADRQLRTDDLLSTAWLLRARRSAGENHFDDPALSDALLAIADARAGSLSPSGVILHRLGGRAWGGIGLAAALVLTLGSLSTQATRSDAAEGSSSSLAARPRETAMNDDAPLVSLSAPAGRTERTAPDRVESGDASTIAAAPLPEGSQPNNPSFTGDPESSDAGTPGAGSGESHTKSGDPIGMPRGPDVVSSADHSTTGRSGTGVGSPSSGLPHSDDNLSATAIGAAIDHRPAPPWQSDHWPDDVARAHRALDANQVPAAYRDLMRDYFREP